MAFLDREFLACLKCTQECFHWHAGHIVARPNIAPSFISLFHCSHHDALRIPQQFSGSFLGKCSGEVKLEGPGGREWSVRLTKGKDVMILANHGWSDFVKDQGLQNGDGLLFTYLGRNIFKVRIFDINGHEKDVQCQLTIPFVETSHSKVYNTNQEQHPTQNPGNCLIDSRSYHGHRQVLIRHHGVSHDHALPHKTSIYDNEHRCSEEIEYCGHEEKVGTSAMDTEILMIANCYQSTSVETNIDHHDNHGKHKPDDHGPHGRSIEYHFEHKDLDDNHPPALDFFDASNEHLRGVTNGHDICDGVGVCNGVCFETDSDDEALRKSGVNHTYKALASLDTSCAAEAFDKADHLEGGHEGRLCTNCEGRWMNSNIYYDKKLMMIQHKQCQSCNRGISLEGMGEEVVQKKIYKLDLQQEDRSTMVETGRKFARIESQNWQAVAAESIRSVNYHKHGIFSQISTRNRALMEQRSISERERQRLICEANAFRSRYPIARKSIKPSYDHKMVLPKPFVQKFMPKKIVGLTLTDTQGKDWPCKWLGDFGGTCKFVPCISAGWSQFAHAHQLKTRDILIFELVDPTSLHFKVHIFKPKDCDVLSQPHIFYPPLKPS